MKTRKLLLSALFTLGMVSCISYAMTVEDHREIDSRHTKSFVKHRDKPVEGKYDPNLIVDFIDVDAVDAGYRNNRAIYSSSSGEGKNGQQRVTSNSSKSKGKSSEIIEDKPRKVKNVTIADGVCQSVDIRNSINNFEMLRGCRTIEGFLQILLMDNATEQDFQNISFPELREITEYMLLFHVKGLKTLHTLFPNLEVIRGDYLFTDYALAIYEMKQLEEIGLTKLTQISRGAVRIEGNPKLCHATTVNWDAIAVGAENIVKNSANETLCAAKTCPSHCPGQHCWTSTDCQKTEKPVCHHLCLVDCFGPTDADCYICKTFRHNGTCLERCPKHLFAFRARRCVTEAECINIPPPRLASKEAPKKWRIHNGECLSECPRGYLEKLDENNKTVCESCHGTCQKNMTGAIVRHISDLQPFRGVTVIQGALEIAIRNGNPNIMKEFTEAFGQVEEITSFLKITHSFPLTSLEFFENLRIIRGQKLDINNSSLVIFDNPNLSKLFPKSQKIQITNGRLFFHYNPRLCMREITHLANMVGITNSTELEIQPDSNGDKVACDIVNINISVKDKGPSSVTLIWDAYKPREYQNLINYILSYVQTENENVSYNGNTCGHTDWQIVDVSIPPSQINAPTMTKVITDLQPYTSYAVYVKTLTVRKHNTLINPTGQSKMMLFRTAADIPSVPTKLTSIVISDTEILIKWGVPEQPNGPIAYYIIRGFLRTEDEEFLSSRDYCHNPVVKTDLNEVEDTPDISFKVLIDDPITCCKKEEVIRKNFDIFCYDNMTLDYQPQSRLNYCLPSRSNNGHTHHDNTFPMMKSGYINKNQLDGIYSTFVFNVTADVFSHKLKNLKHFSLYTISVAACGVTLENGTEMCSRIQYTHARTKDNPKADDIANVKAHVTNDTLVVITWDPVKNPNGLTVAYIIEYTNLIVKGAIKTTKCHPQKAGRRKRSYSIPNLSPGKYSTRVRSMSLAGEGPWSAAVEFSIGIKEDNRVVIAIVVTLGIFIVFCSVSYVYFRSYQKKKQQERLIASVNPDYIESKYIKDNWEVPRENLQVAEALGLGNFGMVYKGILNGAMAVAIKTIPENYTEEDKNEFLNEASVMKNFSTFHIIRLLGVVSEGTPPYVIMELMENGDLKSYLRRIRETDTTGLDLSRIVRMAGEIADGMAYLESKKFIHRDLAARNCMVSKDLVCKIGDFGMARDIYETDYYKIGQKGLLPIRWMAPENLSDGVFTSDSDVWSFGVVLYEILTMGEIPYQGFSNDEVLHHVLRKGTVIIPRNCPELILKLMEKCFKWRPNERPTFMEIVAELEPFLAQDFCEKSFYHSEEGVEIRNCGFKKVYHHAAQIRFHWGNETARWVREFEDNVTLLDQTRAGTSRGRIFKNGFQHLGYLSAMEDVPLDR